MTHDRRVDGGVAELVSDFASAVREIDTRRPTWTSVRTGREYTSGIGPHPETEIVRLVMTELGALHPERYGDFELGVRYPTDTRKRCDLVLRSGGQPLAVEFKLLRLRGDNGKPNDNMVMHIVSPYAAHRSALTDCEKLAHSGFDARAIVIFGFDYDGWPMDPLVDAFELLASGHVELGPRAVASFGDLVHPIHTDGR